MTCNVHFYCLNGLYSQEFADEFHQGQASEDNREFDWEDEFDINAEVLEIQEEENATYTLQGTMPNGTSFSQPVSKVRIVNIHTASGLIQLAVSESILAEITIEKTADEWIVSGYINDLEPHANPIPGIYIASKEFPKALILPDA